jgi:hypothetical protein
MSTYIAFVKEFAAMVGPSAVIIELDKNDTAELKM